MNFNVIDKKMRVYEQSLDQKILPDMYMVARLDGRGFTKLLREKCRGRFEAPFDEEFRDIMILVTKTLMEESGFRIIYGYTESDEISLLFHPDENAFARKTRKYNSTLSGIASAVMTQSMGMLATLDCRMVPLPNIERVQDYFTWRQEDANRNALNSHCYWMLRKDGSTAHAATKMLEGKGVSFKNELLYLRGKINYNDLPSWQKRGVGLWYENCEKEGYNPITKEHVKTMRKMLHTEYELPVGTMYPELIAKLIADTKK